VAEVRIGTLIAIEQPIVARHGGTGVAWMRATRKCSKRFSFRITPSTTGGVILKGDRIAHAACIFPLTRRQD